MTAAYTEARSAVRRRSARVSDAVNPAKIATLPIGSIVVQIVAKSLLILMSKGDMVNEERLTPEVEREREKVTTLKRRRSPLLGHDSGNSIGPAHEYSPGGELSGLRPRRAQLTIGPRRRVGRIQRAHRCAGSGGAHPTTWY